MVTTVLSDEVINSTELRNNQKQWLEKAYISPISIMSGNKKLVILNRDEAKALYQQYHYAKMIIRFCQEQNSGRITSSDVFPWIKHLNKKAIAEFHTELLSTFTDAINGRDWLALEEMINAWISTAEAMTNPEMIKLLNTDLDSEEFTRVE